MSFLSRTLGLDAPAPSASSTTPQPPADPHAPLAQPTDVDTASVKLIALQLSALPPARAH